MTRLVKPNHYEGVDEQRHRRGARDGLGNSIGRVLQAQELLAIFEGAFNGPATSIGREYLPRRPIKLGTIEHLIWAFSFHVARQNDGQQSILSRLVVQGLDRLDRQCGMQPELVELEFSPRSVRIVGPLLHTG